MDHSLAGQVEAGSMQWDKWFGNWVAAGLIRKLGLKPGHWISGTARRSRV